MSRSVVVFLWSAVLVQVWMGASCAAVETANTAVATEAQVTVDGDASYGHTKMPVPTVRQYEDESSFDNPSDDLSDDYYIDCIDQDIACGRWANRGRCETETDLMAEKCPVSCGLCE